MSNSSDKIELPPLPEEMSNITIKEEVPPPPEEISKSRNNPHVPQLSGQMSKSSNKKKIHEIHYPDQTDENQEQYYCIKFCVKFGDSLMETMCKIKQVFGDEAMSDNQITEFYICFKDEHSKVNGARNSDSNKDPLAPIPSDYMDIETVNNFNFDTQPSGSLSERVCLGSSLTAERRAKIGLNKDYGSIMKQRERLKKQLESEVKRLNTLAQMDSCSVQHLHIQQRIKCLEDQLNSLDPNTSTEGHKLNLQQQMKAFYKPDSLQKYGVGQLKLPAKRRKSKGPANLKK